MTENFPVKRAIRSFVRRSGRLTMAQKNAFSSHWDRYGIDYRPQKLDLGSFTEDYSEVFLEIGIGNGDALVEMAVNNSQKLYIGIEVHRPGVGRCLNLINQHGLSNVKVFCHDAIEVMRDTLPTNSLQGVFLFFPDPWHKKRHNKRRIVNQQFRDLCYRLLKSGGFIHMATDWQDYARYMSREFLSDHRFNFCGDNREGLNCRPTDRPETHFERRGLQLGHDVWDLVFEKRQ